MVAFLDSKTLTEAQREYLFEKMNKNTSNVGWMVEVLESDQLSQQMLRM